MVTHALFWGVLCSSVCVFQMTLQQICADVNRVKSWGQQAYLDSNHKIAFLGKRVTGITVSHPLSTKQLKCVFFKLADILNVGCLFCQLLYPLQPPMLRSESTKRAGSKHTFPPISKSTVWITSSGVWR